MDDSVTEMIASAKVCLKIRTAVSLKNKFNLENISGIETILNNGQDKKDATLKS